MQIRRMDLVAASSLALGTSIQSLLLHRPLITDSHSFRQTQTAMLVRQFMRHGFDWRSPLPVFGLDAHVPMEFPIMQGLAGWIGHALGLNSALAMRAVGLIAFTLSAVLTWWLARRWFGPQVAALSTAMFELSIFGLQWGHAALIEFGAVALMLLAVVALELYVTNPRRQGWVACAVSVATLAFLIKATTGVALAPLLALPMLTRTSSMRGALRSSGPALLVAALGVVGAAVWTVQADAVKSGSRLTVWLSSSALREWNFGTLEQRLSPSSWGTLFHTWGPMFGWQALLLTLGLVALRRSTAAMLGLSAALLMGPVVFINLYVKHEYYSAAVFAPACMLAGLVVVRWVTVLRASSASGPLRAVAFSTVLMATMIQGAADYPLREQATVSSTWVAPVARAIDRVVPRGSGVLLLGCDWSPALPYLADRSALMLPEVLGDRIGWRLTIDELHGISIAAACPDQAANLGVDLVHVLPPGMTSEPLSHGLYRLRRG